MPGKRVARLGEQFKREITELLRREVKDPRIGFATITGVDVTPDLYHARVFVSVLGEESEKEQTLEGLAAAASYIRSELGRRLRLRRIPELQFELDRSLEHALRIERLLGEVLPAEPEAGRGEAPSDEREASTGSDDEDVDGPPARG